jgi:predicted RNase H-like HicB family nuclease
MCLVPYDSIAILEASDQMKSIKIIIEKHPDGYIAYPLGVKGVIVGEGSSYDEALADVQSAIRFHIETFGTEVLEEESPVLEAFIAETGVAA